MNSTNGATCIIGKKMATELQAGDLGTAELTKIEKMKKSIHSVFAQFIGHTSNLVKINNRIDVYRESVMSQKAIDEADREREEFFGQIKLSQQGIMADLDLLNEKYADCKTQVESFIKEINDDEQDYEIISLACEEDGLIHFPVVHENKEHEVVETLTKLLNAGDRLIHKIELQQKELIEKTGNLMDLDN